jgi:glycosyltransferase involved in cell wall biosynthesis
MKILTIHNNYRLPGGEEQIFAAESALLEAHEHEVFRYTLNNQDISTVNPLQLAKNTIWNSNVYQDLRSLIRHKKPQIAHFHNTFPLISPAAYYAAKDEGVAVIQTLHNYRLLCPNALFFREGRVCEDCLGQVLPLPSIVHSCYRKNRRDTAMVAATTTFHTLRGTWTQAVDKFIVISQFAKNKFIQGGLPANKLVLKPNFLQSTPAPGAGNGGYAVYVGRLAVEKGLGVLLEAWRQLDHRFPLKIIGDGPMADLVTTAVQEMPEIEWLGHIPSQEVYDIVGNAAFLVFPSEWFETFGQVAIEALAKGTPVVASCIGAIPEMVNVNSGLLFRPSDPTDLATKIDFLLADPQRLAQLRLTARIEFESKYTADRNYQLLKAVYQSVIDQKA